MSLIPDGSQSLLLRFDSRANNANGKDRLCGQISAVTFGSRPTNQTASNVSPG
jgi:hypothetical protein